MHTKKIANSTALVNARPMQVPLFHYHTGCVSAVAVLRVGKCPVYMHIYTHTYALIHVYSYIYAHTYAHTYSHTYVLIHT